jgi:hypothetical protein
LTTEDTENTEDTEDTEDTENTEVEIQFRRRQPLCSGSWPIVQEWFL